MKTEQAGKQTTVYLKRQLKSTRRGGGGGPRHGFPDARAGRRVAARVVPERAQHDALLPQPGGPTSEIEDVGASMFEGHPQDTQKKGMAQCVS